MTLSKDILVLAGLSVRALAEIARAEGFVPVALDLFGDRDTLAVAEWRCIGRGGELAIDRCALLTALGELAHEQDPIGWIAASGFEAHPGLLVDAAQCLDLIGNPPVLMETVRTPDRFYPLLSELGIPHPETRTRPPTDPRGWLVKNARACGGWHVREAARARSADEDGRYFQRQVVGVPMSVLFVANGSGFVRVGVARLRVGPVAGRRWVFKGAVSCGMPGDELACALDQMIGQLVSRLGLRGLNGIDFILGDAGPQLIELNTRPTASISLFRDALAGGLMRAHVVASRGRLPVADGADGDPSLLRGFEVMFARRPVRVDASLADWLAASGWCADLPAPGTVFSRHDPVCTIMAEGRSQDVLENLLEQRRGELLARIGACANGVRE